MKAAKPCSCGALKHRVKRARVALRALCLSCGLMACVTNDHVSGGGYWGTKGAVQGAVEEITELNNKGYLPKSADMNDAVHDLAEAAVTGAVTGAKEGVKDVDLDGKIKSAVTAALTTTDTQLKAIVTTQTPLIRELVRSVVSTSLSTVRSELQPTIQTDLPKATRVVITDAVDSFATAMDTEKVGKVRRDLVDTTGQLTFAASTNAVIGLRSELQKEETQKAVNDMAGGVTETILAKVKEQAKDTIDKTLVAVALLLLAALAMIGFLLFRARAQIRALKLVTAEINKFEHAKDLKQNIARKAQQHAAVDRYLKDFLLDHRL